MGEPVKIVDLANDLIRPSGLSPEDIEIKFTGMRPGEKLSEELFLAEEGLQSTRHPPSWSGGTRPTTGLRSRASGRSCGRWWTAGVSPATWTM
jgi:FlaA1/EpsC-like NDP-sugar epimerase